MHLYSDIDLFILEQISITIEKDTYFLSLTVKDPILDKKDWNPP